MNIIISNSSPLPIYTQIENRIKEMIMSGRLAEGDMLPSMRVLAKELHISIITTKRAYEELEKGGFIVTVAGKGCFVAAKNTRLVRENYLRQVEDSLRQAVAGARLRGIGAEELKEMIEIIYKGE